MVSDSAIARSIASSVAAAGPRRVVTREQAPCFPDAFDRCRLVAPGLQVPFHRAAGGGPLRRAHFTVEAAVGDDFHVTVREQQVDQDSVVGLGVPDAER